MIPAEFAHGRFDVIREIGRGGMGAVYEVFDRTHELRLALKTVARLDPYRVLQLKREFRAVAGLRHRNLVQLYELIAEGEGCFFTMELLDGADVSRWVLRADPRPADRSALALADTGIAPPSATMIPDVDGAGSASSGGPSTAEEDSAAAPRAIAFDEGRLRRAIAELAAGLAFLHEHGVVHRDVKPSNAIVTNDERVVLLDFGLSADWRPQPGRRTSSTPPMAGTIAYMAPEYLHGQVFSPSVDAYALGVVAYELVTGAPPFSGSLYELVSAHIEKQPTPAADVNEAVPPDIDRLICDLLAKDPASRPTAAQARARALGDAAAEPAPRPRERPPFIGRSNELCALDAALAEARGGAPRLAVIHGASGSGKTALLEEFLRRLPVGRVPVFRGRCYEREAVPYRAFDEIAEELAFDLSEGEGVPSGSSAVPRHVSALARLFPSFAQLVEEEGASPPGDARDERERAMGAFADLLALRVRSSGAAVIAIDDLQWADAGSLELLEILYERRRDLPLAIVATVREETRQRRPADEFLARAEARDETRTLALGPLRRDDLRELVHSLANQPVDDDTLRAIERATGGSAYAASAIAHEIAALGPSPDSQDIDVRALETARIERLGGDERRVADAVAAAMGAAVFAELRAATELSGARLLSALHALERARLLRASATPEGEPGYEFYHERLRELTYGLLDPSERTLLHRRLAAAIAAKDETRGLDRQSRQWELAGESEPAARCALAAGDEAREKLAVERAADLYGRAIDLGLPDAARHRARARRAEALLWAGDLAQAAALCRELAAEREGLERQRWLVRCAEAELKLGDLERGIDTLEIVLSGRGLRFRKPVWTSLADASAVSARVLLARSRPPRAFRPRGDAPQGLPRARMARDTEPLLPPSASGEPSGALDPQTRREAEDADVLAEVLRVVAYFLSTPYPRESWEYVLRFVDHARRRGDAGREAIGFAMLSGYLEVASLGRLGGRFLDRAREAAQAADDAYADLVIEAVGVMRATVLGAWRQMRAHAARHNEICRDMGLEGSWEASFLRTYHGLAEIYAGEIDAAIEILTSFLGARRSPDLFSRTLATATYGRALVCAGRIDEAEGLSRRLDESPIAGLGAVPLWMASLRGDLALARGEYAAALRVADFMHREAKRSGLGQWPAFSAQRHTVAAIAHIGLARADRAGAAHAKRAKRHAEALLRAGRGSFYEPTALRLVGQAHLEAGNRARARRALDRAARSAAERGGAIERTAIAALREGGPGDHPALRWQTGGAL